MKLYSYFQFAAPAIANAIYCTLHSSELPLQSKKRFLPTEQGDGQMSKIIDFKSASKAIAKSGSKSKSASEKKSRSKPQPDNVIDFFTRKPLSDNLENKLIRITPELDGLEMLYSNSENQDKLFSVKVLAWGLRSSG